jgi:hypothetical protein
LRLLHPNLTLELIIFTGSLDYEKTYLFAHEVSTRGQGNLLIPV